MHRHEGRPAEAPADDDEDRYWVKVQRATHEAEQAAKDARRIEANGGHPDPHPLEALLRSIVDPEEAADCALAVIEAGMYRSAASVPSGATVLSVADSDDPSPWAAEPGGADECRASLTGGHCSGWYGTPDERHPCCQCGDDSQADSPDEMFPARTDGGAS